MPQVLSRTFDVPVPSDAPVSVKVAAARKAETLARNKKIAAKLPVRYLVRDDGTVYGYNEHLASNPRFRVVGELPAGYIEARENRQAQKEAIAEHSKAHREAAQERLAALRRQKAEAMLSHKEREIDDDKAAEAQAEAEEAFIKSANAETLREFARTNYDVRLPIGETDLTRDAVVKMWMGDEPFEMDEPADWNDKVGLMRFAKEKLFRRMFRGVTLDKARAQVREWLDAYNHAES